MKVEYNSVPTVVLFKNASIGQLFTGKYKGLFMKVASEKARVVVAADANGALPANSLTFWGDDEAIIPVTQLTIST